MKASASLVFATVTQETIYKGEAALINGSLLQLGNHGADLSCALLLIFQGKEYH